MNTGTWRGAGAGMTNEEFKKTLWDTANQPRGSVSAAEYKHPVLGLVFLKYVSDLFDAQAKVIRGSFVCVTRAHAIGPHPALT